MRSQHKISTDRHLRHDQAGEPPRTEGQARLRALPLTGAAIARRIGRTPQAVHQYLAGQIRPSSEVTRRIEHEFKIPRWAWFERPGATEPAWLTVRRARGLL